MVDERLLHRMQLFTGAQALYGDHMAARYPLGWHQTGADGLPVDQHCAGAALALLIARLFGAGQVQVLAQHL